MGARAERALQQVQTVVQAVLPLGPYDLADPVILDKSVVGKMQHGAFWKFEWEALGVWSKARPSAAETDVTLEKRFLVQYWALEETECLTMGP